MEKLIKLRPHHIFCILGFKGLGYDRKFVRNMRAIVNKTKKTPGIDIKLVRWVDDICYACPNRRGDKCGKKPDSEQNLTEREEKIMDTLELGFDIQIKAKLLYNIAENKVAPEMLYGFCLGCDWQNLGICAKGLEKLKAGGFFNEKI